MTNELLPCPYCGGAAIFGTCNDALGQLGGEYIECADCGASTALVFPCMDDAKALLRERWNRRAALTASPVPAGRVADVGFRWDGVQQCHIPKLVIEFEPVPANAPCDAKGWRDRDQLAAMLSAAPTMLNGLTDSETLATASVAGLSAPLDTLDLYKELCDLWREAVAVDTVIGRPEVLRQRIASLRDRVGQMHSVYLPVPVSAPAQQNQCDGCIAGMPLERGIHRDKDGRPVQTCERDRYETAPAQPATEQRAEPKIRYEGLYAFAEEHRISYGKLCSVVREALATPPQEPQAEPRECAASGRGCSFGARGPNGERQCEYCGEAPSVEATDIAARLDPVYAALKDGDCLGASLALERVLSWCKQQCVAPSVEEQADELRELAETYAQWCDYQAAEEERRGNDSSAKHHECMAYTIRRLAATPKDVRLRIETTEEAAAMSTMAAEEAVVRAANSVIALAQWLGVSFTVTHNPRRPFAMGNYDHVVEAWPARTHRKPVLTHGEG